MIKVEAIQAMQEGDKVTHRHSTPDEWMTMRQGMLVLEDGEICTPLDFRQWRTDLVWN